MAKVSRCDIEGRSLKQGEGDAIITPSWEERTEGRLAILRSLMCRKS